MNDSEPRVLLISPLPPPMGGIATWTEKVEAYYRQNNHPLSIVNIAMSGSRSQEENSERNYAEEFKRTKRILKDLKKKIVEFKPDIIHLNTTCTNFGMLRDILCIRIAKGNNIPIVVECRCNIEDQISKPIGKYIFSFLSAKADGVLVLDSYSYRYASGFRNIKLFKVSNFIENDYIRQAHFIKDEVKRILFVGNFLREKGAMEIYNSAEAYPDILFVIAGPVKEDMKKVFKPDNVVLRGRLSSMQVKEELSLADIFLFPSYTEGFSNALLEAMACGLPVIATDVGANKDMVEHDGGIIVSKENSVEVINAIKMLFPKNIRAKMSKWNANKVLSSYTADKVMGELDYIYNKIIQERQTD